MNTDTQPEMLLSPDDDVPARRDTLEYELEKFRRLEEFAKLFLAAKRQHPKAPLPAHC